MLKVNAPMQNVHQKYSRIQQEPEEVEEIGLSMYQSRMDVNKFNNKVRNMETDLNMTVATEIDKNNKLVQSVNQLKKGLEMEKKRTMEIDQRLREEFKEYKRSENEKIENHERFNQRLNEIKSELGKKVIFSWVRR